MDWPLGPDVLAADAPVPDDAVGTVAVVVALRPERCAGVGAGGSDGVAWLIREFLGRLLRRDITRTSEKGGHLHG
ncbi:MAG: hypothetical protein Q8M01_08285 [Rubrivivax sp.]|nr:hypothetical protein [Rubrivivax sp.]